MNSCAYIYTIIMKIVLPWFLRYIMIQIAKSDVYTREMSLQVRRLYQSYVCTSTTFAPVRCLYQCDVWTVQRLYRPTFSWVYQTQGSFFAKESSFHQFQCLTDIPMFGEQILGLKKVITEPKLLYQRQTYSVCNFQRQRLHCIGTVLPPTHPPSSEGAYGLTSETIVPLQLDWVPT